MIVSLIKLAHTMMEIIVCPIFVYHGPHVIDISMPHSRQEVFTYQIPFVERHKQIRNN